MDLRKNKYFLLFLASWGILLIASSLMVKGVDFKTIVAATGVLALVPPVLYFVSCKVGANAPAGRTCTVHSVEDGRVVCRVEGIWIYRGTEEKATWYLRGKKVFAFAEKEYLYRVEDNKIFRRGEEEPCMIVQGGAICSLPGGEPLYRTQE